jgi:hypothetical protein
MILLSFRCLQQQKGTIKTIRVFATAFQIVGVQERDFSLLQTAMPSRWRG